jgi:two-component system NarL family response regulator
MSESLRVLIADDHPLFLRGVQALFASRRDVELAGVAANGQEAVDLYQQLRPDVTVLDVRMPVLSGIDALRQIRQIDSRAMVIMLTSFDDGEEVYEAVRAGARGYLLKETPGPDLIAGLIRVRRGERCLSPSLSDRLAQHIERPALTNRELEVLAHVARGRSNKQIAAHLGIASGTVKSYLEALLSKLAAGDRTEAVTIALRRGMLLLDRL